MTAWLSLLHSGVSTLIPRVSWIARRTVRRFFPATPPLGRELHSGDRLQPVRNRQVRYFSGMRTRVLCEKITARPGAACRKRMQGRQPGELGDRHVGLPQFPRSTRFMREIGEEPPVGREIATAGEDPAAEPCAWFVTQAVKIPLSDM